MGTRDVQGVYKGCTRDAQGIPTIPDEYIRKTSKKQRIPDLAAIGASKDRPVSDLWLADKSKARLWALGRWAFY